MATSLALAILWGAGSVYICRATALFHLAVDQDLSCFSDLLKKIRGLSYFTGSVAESNGAKLEAVQIAWLEEYREMQKWE